MKRTFALWLFWLAGCANEFWVLSPLEGPRDGGHLERDAAQSGNDAGAAGNRDAQSMGLDAADDGGEAGGEPRDASVQADSGALDGDVASADAASDGSPPALSAFAQSCAAAEGLLSCWGQGASGQLDADGGRPEPRPLSLAEGEFTDLCTGQEHACALRADQTLLCWGRNSAGQLGLGDTIPRSRPTPVPAARFVAVACGGLITCGIAEDGALSCWGSNLEGTLGQGDAAEDPADSATPVRVPDLTVSDVSVGQGHVCAIAEGGVLYCWGRNTMDQLGASTSVIQIRSPLRVDSSEQFARVAAGMNHTCALTPGGRLYCWGDNGDEENPLLGLGFGPGRAAAPTLVGSDVADYESLSVGWFHACAIRQDGALYCWGRNREGQLGLGDSAARAVPSRVGSNGGWRVVATGQFHTCGARANGIYCWGYNGEGQLGLGDLERRYIPFAVPLSASAQ